MLNLNDLFDTLIPRLHFALNPFDQWHDVRVLIAQSLRELHDKGTANLFPLFQLLNDIGNDNSLFFIRYGQQFIS